VPHYEYACDACQSSFDVTITLHEHEKEVMRCPQCGSEMSISWCRRLAQ
jgi:putative FmdB family regulatory protein